ncbi:helix-turn-helix transcriptional regulator [Enterococcus sp. S86.2]|uniref:helix-turn-helix domain-containing protein n=1 Tax=Enterococcus sp. S86.2 TaxID=3031299 RepID=UPI0026F30830|nr:helix-turn-helix transcriptional regulator [Enterococcus sp. S86.2]
MINNFSRILGERLLKISQVSTETEISRTTLTNFYYKRNKNISYQTLEKICDYLEISLSELLEYEPKKD